MNRIVPVIAGCVLVCSNVMAAKLTCASDPDTDKRMCFLDDGLRASTDKKVREFRFFSGGPKALDDSGYTARVFCDPKFVPVIEMRDRRGVVFARNQAATKAARDLTTFVCEHAKLTIDKTLDTVTRY